MSFLNSRFLLQPQTDQTVSRPFPLKSYIIQPFKDEISSTEIQRSFLLNTLFSVVLDNEDNTNIDYY